MDSAVVDHSFFKIRIPLCIFIHQICVVGIYLFFQTCKGMSTRIAHVHTRRARYIQFARVGKSLLATNVMFIKFSDVDDGDARIRTHMHAHAYSTVLGIAVKHVRNGIDSLNTDGPEYSTTSQSGDIPFSHTHALNNQIIEDRMKKLFRGQPTSKNSVMN